MNEKFYLILGKNIEKYRKSRGMSAEELGNRVGLTKNTIRRYEKGSIKVLNNRVVEIAKSLDIDPKLLYQGTQLTNDLENNILPTINLPYCGNITDYTYEPDKNKFDTYMSIPAVIFDEYLKKYNIEKFRVFRVNVNGMDKEIPFDSIVITNKMFGYELFDLCETQDKAGIVIFYDPEEEKYDLRELLHDESHRRFILRSQSEQTYYGDIFVYYEELETFVFDLIIVKILKE
jgi:transcriptional regulator with XRE-family HTH domain